MGKENIIYMCILEYYSGFKMKEIPPFVKVISIMLNKICWS